MVQQAQQAIGNNPLPQNTQLPSEVINEDDAAIQDMLNNLSHQDGGAHQEGGRDAPQYMPQIPPMQMQQSPQEELMRLAAANNLNINQLNQLMNGYGPPGYPSGPSQFVQQQAPPVQGYARHLSGLKHVFSNELKLAGLVFFVVILVQFVPFHRYIGKYISIENIPYNEILLRAIIASLVVVVFKKMLG
jgi:hypothetical protein